MRWTDRYTGRRARTYDADRCHSPRWAREQIAVEDWVFPGPLLDVPLGTGRYCSIYKSKGIDVIGLELSPDMIAIATEKYPWLDARQGSIFEIPFAERRFETAVCTRMLDWLAPHEMQDAVAELRRVARTLIVTIRHGLPEHRVNYTHELSAFYEAISGLHVEQRRVTEITEQGTEEIFRLRPPLWKDVASQFQYNPVFMRADDEIQRLASVWDGRLWRGNAIVSADTVDLTAEYWRGFDLWKLIPPMAAVYDHEQTNPLERYICDAPPARTDGPVTLLRVNPQTTIVLDGRRRINQARYSQARHPVLLLTLREGRPDLHGRSNRPPALHHASAGDTNAGRQPAAQNQTREGV